MINTIHISVLSWTLIGFIFGQVTIPEKPNPHGRTDCTHCHIEGETPNKQNYATNSCDNCHVPFDIEINHIHPISGNVTEQSSTHIPADFPLENGNLTCITCHKPLCKTDSFNPSFLRKEQNVSDLDFCFSCHSDSKYEQMNPHHQKHESGDQKKDTCLLCHTHYSDTISEMAVNVVQPINETCNKCHAFTNHEKNHLGKQITNNSTMYAQLENTLTEHGVPFPLGHNNEIQCNTCHYTHEKNILDTIQAFYLTEMENKYFLRLPKVNTCYACHKL